jgi:hypothetical protein
MPKYDERYAQEAQEEEYLRLKHLDDEYWYAQFSNELRIKEPPFVAMALNSQGQLVMVRGLTEDEVHVACFANQLQLLDVYYPKQFI